MPPLSEAPPLLPLPSIPTKNPLATRTYDLRQRHSRCPLFLFIERNPVRAGLVERAQDWRWSSAAPARFGSPLLDAGPLPRPQRWLQHVNAAQTEAEVAALRECIRRRRPYGEATWVEQAAERLGLQSSLRPRGRPKKKTEVLPSLFTHIDDPE